MKKFHICIIDDEEILRVSVADELKDIGHTVIDFGNPQKALEYLKNNPAEVVVTDIKMPEMDGFEVLRRVKQMNPDTYVLVMTAFGSIDSAVRAMKEGAYDYLTKPFEIDEIVFTLKRIAEVAEIKSENKILRSQLDSEFSLDSFVGKSQQVQQTLDLVKTVANTDTTVLITGETGSGKELLAHVIHHNSERRSKPLIKVSCAILSREIFESELFGHEKGAFTGAQKAREGRFEMANGGTIYLDDVDDIPMDLQVKLLRVLQEQEVERVGGNQTIKIDVRVIASTKADLKKLVKEGKFREDLYYRLNVFPINIPPLRNRKEDIPELITHFARQFSSEQELHFDERALQCLTGYHWPGNVRELKNIVERLLLLSKNRPKVDISLLPVEIVQPDLASPEICLGEKPLNQLMAEIEQNLIIRALKMNNGNQLKTSELLGIPPSTLRTKMNKYNIK
ncbi:MAG: sigma-54 dependent transcriptional regulator [Calditrichia bacterium]